MKLKDYLKKILEIPKDLFKKFPFSISLSILASFMIAIFLENDFLGDIIYFIFLFPTGILFSEIYFKDNKKFRIVSFVIALIIAVLGNKYIKESNELGRRLAAVYAITLVILGLIKLLKDSKLSLNEYLTRVGSNSFKVQIVSSILSTGLLLITGIIVALFKTNDLLIVRMELIFAGVFWVPATIYAFSETESKAWDFFGFIKNLSSVILIAAFAVIYIYMLKIFITWNIPSNQIFRIASLLFIMGLPIWTMVTSFEKDNILVKICDKLPLAFIPFIGLQTYSLVVRINDNGYTIMRYLGIFLIIFEVLYIIKYIVKKDKIYRLGYVLIVMSVIAIIAPKINATDFVVKNQYNRLTKLLEKKNLSGKEKAALYSSYIYLLDFKEGKALIDMLTDEQINYILQEKEVFYDCYYLDNDIKYSNVDVSGYKTFNEFEVSSNRGNIPYEEFEHIKVRNHDVNMSTQIIRFIESKKDDIEYKSTNTIVEDNYKLTIEGIEVCVEDSYISSYTISGYILEK